jgi:hypothetical protein
VIRGDSLYPSLALRARGQKEEEMATPGSGPLSLGFLTILQEPTGYVGGYLVTNVWGRPLEFRLTSAVQPNRVQQILYAETLAGYLCGKLIGKTLLDKTGIPVHLVVTDREAALDLRLEVEIPVVWLQVDLDPDLVSPNLLELPDGRGRLVCHPRHPGDLASVEQLLRQIDHSLDLAEPFGRIREALAEARKLGVTGRMAA